jgi:hypothetical protein
MKNLKTLFFATSIILITACGNEPSSKKQAPPIEGTYELVEEDSNGIFIQTLKIKEITKDSFEVDIKRYYESYVKEHINDRRAMEYLKYNHKINALMHDSDIYGKFSDDYNELTTFDNRIQKKIK